MAPKDEAPNISCRGRVRIHCPIETIWAILLDWVEYPSLYDTNVKTVYIHERAGDTKLPLDRSAELKEPKLKIRHRITLEHPSSKVCQDPPGLVAECRLQEEEIRALFNHLAGGPVEEGVLTPEVLTLPQFLAASTDESLRDFCAQIPGFANFLEATKTEERAAKLFETLDTSEVYGGRKDSFVSWIELLAYLLPQDPRVSGRIIWQIQTMGGTDAGAEQKAVKGRIMQTIKEVDEGVVELSMSCQLLNPGDTTDFTGWVKAFPLSMKTVVDRITRICPSLGLEAITCTRGMHHRVVKKAQSFKFMPLSLSQSPSAMGAFWKSATPGRGDGFSTPQEFVQMVEAPPDDEIADGEATAPAEAAVA